MLYGQTNEKDSWGAEFPLAEPSISCQLREVRLAEGSFQYELGRYPVSRDLTICC